MITVYCFQITEDLIIPVHELWSNACCLISLQSFSVYFRVFNCHNNKVIMYWHIDHMDKITGSLHYTPKWAAQPLKPCQKLPVHCLCADVNAIGGLECWSYWGDFYTLCVIYHFVTELLWFPYNHLALKLLPVDRVVCKKENILSYYSKKSKSSQNLVSSLVQPIFSQIFVNVKCMTRCLILHTWHWECKHLNSKIKKCGPVLLYT